MYIEFTFTTSLRPSPAGTLTCGSGTSIGALSLTSSKATSNDNGADAP